MKQGVDSKVTSANTEKGFDAASTGELLAEIGKRLRLRFGRLEVVFHDGSPSPKIMVEHRLLKELDE